jgi:colanic acid/amylovoran biosynthesis glycosyltransferase
MTGAAPGLNHARTAVLSGEGTPVRVSYVIGRYPVLTETFIDREIERLVARGTDLKIIAIRRPDPNLSPAQVELARRVTYLLPASMIGLLRANLWALRRPGTYIGTLMWLLTRRHGRAPRRRTALHFLTGVYAAWMLRDRRGVHLHAHFVDRAATVALVAARFLDTTYSATAHAREIYVDPVLLPERIGNAVFAATCTDYNRRHLIRVLGGEIGSKIVRLYHGLDLGPYMAVDHRTSRVSNEPPLILAVAQLMERKGLRYLIEACQLLTQRGRIVQCEIVGDGPLREELEALASRDGLARTVSLTGPLPHHEVVARLRRAAAFVLPCIVADDGDRDGIPNVILEAMAAAVPVVSTAVSGIPEVVRDGTTGLLVPERDPRAIADAVERLLDDADLASRLGQAARAFVRSEFDLDRNVERLLERFAQVSAAATSGA